MLPAPPDFRDSVGITSDSAEPADRIEVAALITYFEEGLAALDRLGLAEAANYICWGLDILKSGQDPS